MRAVSLHRDVIVVTSRLMQTNCTIVRAPAAAGEPVGAGGDGGEGAERETFVVDSPVLPDELELLPSVLGQAGFAPPSGLLATHADWDHLLGPLAFDAAPLGLAESSARRLAEAPGEAQRDLRAFDEELYLERPRPLSLTGVQALPVPGRCELGGAELELHAGDGHTGDGMAILVPWAGALLAGDYLSSIEIPMLGPGGTLGAYRATLERLGPLLAKAGHVVPGHGPLLEASAAEAIRREDLDYIEALAREGERAELPAGRRGAEQRRIHAENVTRL